MTITTLSSRELNQDVTRAKKATKSGPVFITDRGKIIARRITGTCAKCQRRLTLEIKRARQMAMLYYTATHSAEHLKKM